MRTLAILGLFLSLLLITACGSKHDAAMQGPPAIPVVAVSPLVQDVPVFLESLGTLHPSVYMEIRPRVSGSLIEVLVEEGQWVDKDTPLFKINPRKYLGKLQEVEAQIAMDRASLDAAQKKLNRCLELAEKDLIPGTEWDELETKVAKSQAAIDANTAKLATAQTDVEKCTVISPIAGRIGKLDAHPGLQVAPEQKVPLATIAKMDPLLLEFTLTEQEFVQLPKDQKTIEVQALHGDKTVKEGVITFLDNHFDRQSGLLLVRGKVENPSLAMRPGQHVHVRIPIAQVSNATLIPQKAVKYNQQGPYVFVVQPDASVISRQLVLGSAMDNHVIVLEGLDPTERVVSEGHLRLYPGAIVEVQP